jgi:hypothetical protein
MRDVARLGGEVERDAKLTGCCIAWQTVPLRSWDSPATITAVSLGRHPKPRNDLRRPSATKDLQRPFLYYLSTS